MYIGHSKSGLPLPLPALGLVLDPCSSPNYAEQAERVHAEPPAYLSGGLDVQGFAQASLPPHMARN